MAEQNSFDWLSFPAAIEDSGKLSKTNDLLRTDEQFLAFCRSCTSEDPVVFGIKSSGSQDVLNIAVDVRGATASPIKVSDGLFTLSAQQAQWQAFFTAAPRPPFHSYSSIRFANLMKGDEAVLGDVDEFARYSHIWRRALELIRIAVCGPVSGQITEDEPEEDHLTGRYVYLDAPNWGRCKVYYEQSGTGNQDVVFIHTAGSDTRQLHKLMNDERMLKNCKMYAFDLPSHGKSLPGSKVVPGVYKMTEDDCIAILAEFIKNCKLTRPIVCGASMARMLFANLPWSPVKPCSRLVSEELEQPVPGIRLTYKSQR